MFRVVTGTGHRVGLVVVVRREVSGGNGIVRLHQWRLLVVHLGVVRSGVGVGKVGHDLVVLANIGRLGKRWT